MSQFPWIFSFQNWAKTFKKYTYPTTIIPLTQQFIDFLLSDGITLPSHIGEIASSSNDTSTTGALSDTDTFFPDIISAITRSLTQYPEGVFPKVEWYSPIDAVWVQPDSTMRCIIPRDILLLINSSSVCHSYLQQCSKTDDAEDNQLNGTNPQQLSQVSTTPSLYLRKWYDTIHPSEAFRVFVYHHHIIAISQKDGIFYSKMQAPEYLYDIWAELVNFHSNRFAPSWNTYVQSPSCMEHLHTSSLEYANIQLDSYIYDVIVHSKTFIMKVVDIYPFSPDIPSILYTPDEIYHVTKLHEMFNSESSIFKTLYSTIRQFLSLPQQHQSQNDSTTMPSSSSPISLSSFLVPYTILCDQPQSPRYHPLSPLISPYSLAGILPTTSLNLVFIPILLIPPVPLTIMVKLRGIIDQYTAFIASEEEGQESESTFYRFVQSYGTTIPPLSHPVYSLLFDCYRLRLLLDPGLDPETLEGLLLSELARIKTTVTEQYVSNRLEIVSGLNIPTDCIEAYYHRFGLDRPSVVATFHEDHPISGVVDSPSQGHPLHDTSPRYPHTFYKAESVPYTYNSSTTSISSLEPSSLPSFPHPYDPQPSSSPIHTIYIPLFPPKSPSHGSINIFDLDDEMLCGVRVVTPETRLQAQQTKTIQMEANRLPDEDMTSIDVSNAQGIDSLIEMMKFLQTQDNDTDSTDEDDDS